MITGFMTFEAFHGRKNIGGTRLRAHWPIARWNDAGPDIGPAALYRFGDKPDVMVYQKVYNFEHAENFDGIKILDLCDPDFLHPAYPVKRMIEACDAVVCCTEALAAAVAGFAGNKPVHVIADHVLDPESAPIKEHKGELKTVSWYGYADNFPALESAVVALKRRGLKLIVVATKPYTPISAPDLDVVNYPWSADNWVADFMRADVVINPKLADGRFPFKSDNKTIQAWTVGMPVIDNDADFDRFQTAEQRATEGLARRQWVIENRDVRRHVEQLKEVILSIKK